MPVCSEKGCVDYTQVRTDILHLLGIPERECIVVAMCHEDTVRTYRVQIVLRHLHRSVTVASVMVIPVLRGHERRYSEEGHGYSRGNCSLALLRAGLLLADVAYPSIY